ncbi:MAG TPA: hypothetical protein VF826_05785 [Chloroflexia bacterium]
MAHVIQATRAGLKPHFWVGVALLILGHVLIFARTPAGEFLRPTSDYWFAAVWFGYIFALDALLYRRDGRSLFVSHRKVFLWMLPLSAVGWLGFEGVNWFVQNWHYLRPFDIPEWWAQLWSMIFFSTVIPAVWETAQWVGGWGFIQRLGRTKTFAVRKSLLVALVIAGVLFFVLPALFPLYFFPLIWGFAALILDPINYVRAYPSILGYWSRGDWRVPLALFIGGTICGFLWEFWNFWAFPKWYYTIPFVGFGKIFEMPVLGYLGYGPFSWELFALFWFFAGLILRKDSQEVDDVESIIVPGSSVPKG